LDEATSAACTVTHSPLQPRVLELIDLQDAMWGDTSRDESAPALLITFGDIPEAVDYQVERGASAMHEAGSTEVRTLSEEDVGAWHTRIRDVLDAAHEDPTVVVCRIGTLMTTVPLVLRVVGQLAGPSEPGVQSMVDWSDGIVRAVVSVPASAETSEVASAVEKVRQQVMEAGGRLVVESAPADVKRLLDVWGPPTGPVALMQQLKDRLDPHHLLNRGRYHREIGG
jgi:FAD/FMN-containing dehydrogenase